MKQKKRFYTWQEFLDDMYGRIIPALRPHARKFNGVWGPPRGGLVMAVILSHNLNIPYLLKPRGQKTLIVDDIVDSGQTLRSFRKFFIVTCFWRKGSRIKPTLWLHKKKAGEWIVFPWETAEENGPE